MKDDEIERIAIHVEAACKCSFDYVDPAVAIRELQARIAALHAERDAAQSALATFIYETTHLSPEEDDGSHWCKISKECLEAGRRARSNKEPGQ